MDRRVLAVMFGAALALWVLGLALGVARVYRLERGELEYEGPSQTLKAWARARGHSAVSARLAEVHLQAGDRAVFEVCTQDRLAPKTWAGALDFAVLRLSPMQLMLRVSLDEAHLAMAQRSNAAACLPLGSGPIEREGRYSVDAVWPDAPPPQRVMDIPMRARVLARRPTGTRDTLLVICLAFSTLWMTLLGWGVKLQAAAPEWPTMRPTYVGLCGALVALGAAAQLPLWGSTLGLAKGLLLAALQVSIALGWAGLSRAVLGPTGAPLAATLALGQPRRPRWHLLAGALAWPALVASARLSLSLIPSTGEAPIETFISWPSGKLAFAVLGAVLPLAEELFFRGFVFGALRPLGTRLAFAVTVLAFTGLHAQQSWGNWGALTAICGTAVVLTGLRAWSGSILPGALAHTLYNTALSLRSL